MAIASLRHVSSYSTSTRRSFLARSVTVGVTFVAATKPADAAEQSPEDKEAEKRRKEKEKEDRRLAEEAKKRLAVGRIGTI